MDATERGFSPATSTKFFVMKTHAAVLEGGL